jgi:hypothetical protein
MPRDANSAERAQLQYRESVDSPPYFVLSRLRSWPFGATGAGVSVCHRLEDEGIIKGPSTRFWQALHARHYTGLDLVDFVIVPNEIHTSVLLDAVEEL